MVDSLDVFLRCNRDEKLEKKAWDVPALLRQKAANDGIHATMMVTHISMILCDDRVSTEVLGYD